MFGRKRQEFQCLKGCDKNSNVWKEKKRILNFKEWDKNSNVWKDGIKIVMFGRIR